jgi:hypothetical protein
MRHNRCYRAPLLALLGSGIVLLLAACGPNIPQGGSSTGAPPATSPQTAQTHALTLEFRCHGGAGGFYVDRLGTQARVCVQTAPGAALTITVSFCKGAPDPSSELKGTVYADSAGYYEWNWKPRPDCQGRLIYEGEAVVHAQLNGQKASLSTSFYGD